jgi:hypothetical protein
LPNKVVLAGFHVSARPQGRIRSIDLRRIWVLTRQFYRAARDKWSAVLQLPPIPALVGDIVSLRVRADAIAVVKFAGAAVEKISQRRFLFGSHSLSSAGKADAGHL